MGWSIPGGDWMGRTILCSLYQLHIRQNLFYSAQFYRTSRLKLQRQLNTVQLRNKRKKKNVTIN